MRTDVFGKGEQRLGSLGFVVWDVKGLGEVDSELAGLNRG